MRTIKFLQFLNLVFFLTLTGFSLQALDSDDEWEEVKQTSSRRKPKKSTTPISSESSSRRSSISARHRDPRFRSTSSSRVGSPRPTRRSTPTYLQDTDTYLAYQKKTGALNPYFKPYKEFPKTKDIDKSYLNQFVLRLASFRAKVGEANHKGKPYTLQLGENSLTMLKKIKEESMWVLDERPQGGLYVGMIVEAGKIVRHMDMIRLKADDLFSEVVKAMYNFDGLKKDLKPFTPINTLLSLSKIMAVPTDLMFHKLINEKTEEIDSKFRSREMRPILQSLKKAEQETSEDDLSFEPGKIKLHEQDLLAAVIIAYQMMPDADYEPIRKRFARQVPPLERAIGIVQMMQKWKVNKSTHSLFAPKLLQLFYWSLLIEKNNSPHSINEGFLKYIRSQFTGQRNSIRSGAEHVIERILSKAILKLSPLRTAPFYDVYERVANDDPYYKALNLFTEIDFVFRPKKGSKNDFIFFEVDGPHHFVRDLETYGTRPETMTGQTHLKTKLLLQRGNVVRMSLMCAEGVFQERLNQMPQIIHDCETGSRNFALVDPENYPINYQQGGVRVTAPPDLRNEEEFPSL